MTPASDPLLSALRSHRSPIRRVRYRANRTVLLSISRDGTTLNSHRCFREAPPEIAEAVAVFVTTRRGSARARRALAILRGWEGTEQGLKAARQQRPRRRRVRTNGPETGPLREMFDQFNRDRFHGQLPAIPLRISRRMRRSLGTIRYGPVGGMNGSTALQGRSVLDIAISVDLLLPANRESLEDTLLHEMAHAEAWLRHGHRGHGRPWRQVAGRVGCTPRATCHAPIVRTPRRRAR